MSKKILQNILFLACMVNMHAQYGTFANNKTVIFVLGMHRSGTSAVAGLLYYLGIYSGEKLIGVSKKNKRPRVTPSRTVKALPLYQKFEHRATYLLNASILMSLGTSWHDYSDFSIDWNKNLNDYYYCIEKAWASDLLRYNVFFVKDPRISLLLPLYLEYVKRCGYTPKLIIVQRDLHEIAQSVSARSSLLSLQQSYTLAQKYYAHIENYSKGHDILVLHYTDILAKLDMVLERLSNFLSLPKITKKQKKILRTFVKKGLRHFTTTEQEI